MEVIDKKRTAELERLIEREDKAKQAEMKESQTYDIFRFELIFVILQRCVIIKLLCLDYSIYTTK